MSFSAGIARSGNFNIYERREHDLNVADRRSLARFVVRAKIFSVRGFVQKRCITHTAEHLADRARVRLDCFVYAAFVAYERNGSGCLMHLANRAVITNADAAAAYTDAVYRNLCVPTAANPYDAAAAYVDIDRAAVAFYNFERHSPTRVQRGDRLIRRAVIGTAAPAIHQKRRFKAAFAYAAFKGVPGGSCFVAAGVIRHM